MGDVDEGGRVCGREGGEETAEEGPCEFVVVLPERESGVEQVQVMLV